MAEGQEPETTPAGQAPEGGQQPQQPQQPQQQGGQGQEPETFDREYVAKLRSENAAARTRANELEAKVKTFEDRDKTEQQRLNEQAEVAAKRADAAEAKSLRFEAAAAAGVPLEDAHRLQGTTKEELAKDAEQFAKRLGAQQAAPAFNGGARAPAPTGSMDDLIRQASGRGR